MLGCIDAIEDRPQSSRLNPETRSDLASSLASLLHRQVPHNLGDWNRAGSTEPLAATAAWIVPLVGWLSDGDEHVVMRAVENLAPMISSIPARDRSWGIDAEDLRAGFQQIKQQRPDLWQLHGPQIVQAATDIGGWGADRG